MYKLSDSKKIYVARRDCTAKQIHGTYYPIGDIYPVEVIREKHKGSYDFLKFKNSERDIDIVYNSVYELSHIYYKNTKYLFEAEKPIAFKILNFEVLSRIGKYITLKET